MWESSGYQRKSCSLVRWEGILKGKGSSGGGGGGGGEGSLRGLSDDGINCVGEMTLMAYI